MTWQLFTLISVLSLSISVILQRTLLHKHRTDPYAYAAVFQGIVGVLLLVFALGKGFSLPNFAPYIVPALVSVLCFGVGHIFYAKTLQRVEASAFSVLFASQAIWTMLLGILLLGESITAAQIAGSVLILASTVILAKNFHAAVRDRGVLLGLATGVLFGVGIYFWSYVGRYTDGLSWAAISFVATSLVVVAIRPGVVVHLQPLLKPAVATKLLLLAMFYGLGGVMMLYAYKYGSFAIVSPLRQTSIIVTVLLAFMLLPSERKHVGRKITAAVLSAIGVALIVA